MDWTSAQDRQLESGLAKLQSAVQRGTSFDFLGQIPQTGQANQARSHEPSFLNVPLDFGELTQRLAAYAKILLQWQEAFHLLGEPKDLVDLHLLDSVSGAFLLLHLFPGEILGNEQVAGETVWQIVDVGSGLGLPGIPLALCLLQNYAQSRKVQFYLVESARRRANILRSIVRELDLQSFVTVCGHPVEEWGKYQNLNLNLNLGQGPQTQKLRRIVTCRAFHRLDKRTMKQLQIPLSDLNHPREKGAGREKRAKHTDEKARSGGILLYKGNLSKAHKELQELDSPQARWLSSTFQLPHCEHQRSLFYSEFPS